MSLEPALRDRLLAAVDEEAATDLLRRLVQTPSITRDEGAVARLLGDELRNLGLERVEIPEFAPGRHNVIAVEPGQDDGAGLLLLGHIDTVHVDGWADAWADTERESPYCAQIVDGEMWGRGTADQKAGIAAIVSALRALRQAGLRPRRPVVCAFVGDEESGEPESGFSDGIKAVLPQLLSGELPATDFAIYTEPTRMQIFAAQMGFLTADIDVIGESTYFGTPWLGRDAVRDAHRLLSRLWDHSTELWDNDTHELVGRPFLLVTGIEGGGYIAVPGRCRISLIRKLLPTETLDEARDALDSLLQRAAIEDGVRSQINYTAPRDHPVGGTPSEAPLSAKPIARLQRLIREVRPDRGEIEGAPYWSEMSFLQNELGIPAVYFAPGDISTAHTTNERVPMDEFHQAVAIFTLLIAEHCGVVEI